ncbi:DsbA family protein [Pseudothioclava arenosa]|uniref:Thiol-disulfide oxidoreductase n=1 Tax=Pseudothioclava arenosa TaxID=1795308 RepID=A0A2A4CQH4_9RHOB|nr:DsbA family protein [Pseudothioclava arenosa]PCD76389.1 thiol-disulfide oxidoreductase [Pseudothioclava arenosa]
MSNSKTFLFGGIALAAVAAVGLMLTQRAPEATTSVAAALESAVSTPAEASTVELLPDYVMGEETAPITLIEYASYTCPHCATWHEEVFPALKRDYIDSGKVKFIHREVYFDRFGLLAGQIAQCGGAPRYYAMSGLIYDSQAEWIGDGKPETILANLRKLGLKAGLSDEQIEACVKDDARRDAMVATYQANASKDEITATPSMVINGTKYSNMSYEELKKVLDGLL